MAQYNNGDSHPTKLANWQQLERFFKRQKGRMFDQELVQNINATQHEKPGAAEILIIWLYETMTGRRVKTIPGEYTNNYTDDKYQIQLPLYARHTASSAIKVNSNLVAILDAIFALEKSKNYRGIHLSEPKYRKGEDAKDSRTPQNVEKWRERAIPGAVQDRIHPRRARAAISCQPRRAR